MHISFRVYLRRKYVCPKENSLPQRNQPYLMGPGKIGVVFCSSCSVQSLYPLLYNGMKPIYLSFLLIGLVLPAFGAPLTIYAAVSTIQPMKQIEQLWAKDGGRKLRIVYGSSGGLARQISSGAPANIYVSANKRWVDYLISSSVAVVASRRVIMKNRLVLIAPTGKRHSIKELSIDIPRLLGKDGRIAIGDPSHVPVGLYAREAMTSLGIWKTIRSRSARTQNARLVLSLVRRGETPLGIVYRTEVENEPSVQVLKTFPEKLHTTIEYQAILTENDHAEADDFLDLLNSSKIRSLYRSAGFIVQD